MRLGTDYVDVYTLHWPARYTPQSNWGQSLMYHVEQEQAPWYKNAALEEIAEAMGSCRRGQAARLGHVQRQRVDSRRRVTPRERYKARRRR